MKQYCLILAVALCLTNIGCVSRNRSVVVAPPKPTIPVVATVTTHSVTNRPAVTATTSTKPVVAPAVKATVPTAPLATSAATKPAATAPAKPVSPTVSPATSASSNASRETRNLTAYLLKAGDPIVISIRGIPREDQIEDIIDEEGNISLPLINQLKAAGKTSSELERDIERAYVDQQYYKNPAVNVVIPARSYYVRGEVRQPGRYPLISGVTVVQAIAAAGGYTEFADSTDVKVVREGKTFKVNARELEKHPEKDQPLESGDVVVVTRSWL